MSTSRLSVAVQEHGLSLPSEGRIAVFAPRADADLSALDRARVEVVQPVKPDHDVFERAGFATAITESGRYSVAVVMVPRAKAQAKDLISRAAACADLIVVDGQKTDGIDSFLKETRKRADLSGSLSKSHGRIFWFEGGEFGDWLAPETQDAGEGFVTRAGVFSADAIDPASRALAAALPPKLGRVVADLGAGWGYLSSQILKRDGVEVMHLVEADHVALECAKLNIKDARAQFHWNDVRDFKPGSRVDTVVMNPPFHTGRKAEPDLGVQFIRTAAKILAPAGQLWMVANRHLPYESALRESFVKVEEVAGDRSFKILHAQRPSRTKR
ncbi:16S rRNA (guanine1207-N2)-methyltransferase [Shimia isoporae]|uniref:16S rRNA (Guanine1207-N2)-methyltransferase n=1 Tax=Shimia isoporae TaxID=647720 RepID=A0A4R1NJ99_9RHOB|nr:class I SAM-dependent methyltransferase [Shimia isoporae]TCL08085.1 16S rRNA (guanine1207-N2)-methyltransferase [Shimia isoporae]